jgi:hypothetical protein
LTKQVWRDCVQLQFREWRLRTFAGPPSALNQVEALPADASLINGMNDHSVQTATTYAGSQQAVFVGTSGSFATFTPPGAVGAGSGFINNAR